MWRLFFLPVLCFSVFCQDAREVVQFSLDSTSIQSIRTDTVSEIRFIVSVQKGWHMFSNTVEADYLIPTRLDIQAEEGVSVRRILFPKGVKRTFFNITEYVYEGVFALPVRIRVNSPGRFRLTAVLKYQTCNEQMCLPPAEKKIVFEQVSFGLGLPLPGKGILSTLLFLFLGGLLLNLTPCVYPVVPITLSFFAGQAGSNKARTALLAGCYVLGIALTYSALGTLAALSGSMMGAALQHPAVLGAVVTLFVILSLSMFGLYEIHVPAFISSLGVGRQGPAGALLMGLIVGIVAAPCVGPVTAGLLLHVAQRHEAATGFLYFFTLSLGLGAPYFVLGFFSGSLSSLPGSGGWMVWIRKFFGFVLLLMAVYYTRPLLPEGMVSVLFLVTSVSAAVYLGFIEKSAAGRFPAFMRFQKIFGVCVLAFSIIYFTRDWKEETSAEYETLRHEGITVEKADRLRGGGVPFVIDFRADWCAPCRKFEEAVLTNGRVKKALERVCLYTVDVTRSDNRPAQAMADHFKVVGVPTIIFLDAAGREKERVTEYVDTESFLSKLSNITPKEAE